MRKKLEKKREIKSYYGLRALAVIFVSMYHITPHIFLGGYLGVVIFLVMSGYLVTDGFFNILDKNKRINILFFWKKRLNRLYGPLIPMLAFTSMVVFALYREAFYDFSGSLLSSLFGINNIYQIIKGFSYFDSREAIRPLTHIWSLGLEIQFYLIWPIIIVYLTKVLRLKKKTISRIILLISLISATLMAILYEPNTDVTRIYYGIDTRAFSFVIGSYFATVLPRKKLEKIKIKDSKKAIISTISSFMILTTIYLMYNTSSYSTIVYRYGMFIFSVLVALIMILLLINENITSKILSNHIFVSIGKRSYSIYLYQYMVMVIIGSFFVWSKTPRIIVYLIEITTTLVLAEISYRLFEKKDSIINRNLVLKHYFYLATIIILITTSIMSLYYFKPPVSEVKNRIEELETNVKELGQINDKILKEEKRPSVKNSNNINKMYTFIGDSVMLCAKEDINKYFNKPIIDAKVSRQYWDLDKVITTLKRKNEIHDDVIIHLGNNCVIDKKSYKNVLKKLKDKNIYLINCVIPNSWEKNVNKIISEISNEMKNVQLIDWYSHSKGKKDWFYKDATHPNLIGAKKYAELIKNYIIKQ